MAFEELKQIQADQQAKEQSQTRHDELLDSSVNVSNTVLDAIMSLIEYMEGHVSQVQVINPLTSVGTPDAFKVVEAVHQLDLTLKQRKSTDLTEITDVMKQAVAELEKLPKEHPEVPDEQSIDYTPQFEALIKAIEAVDKAVKDQDLHIEAPQVHVEKPDLGPITASLAEVVRAVHGIEIPKPESPYTKSGKSVKVELEDGAVPTAQKNILITEKFDEYRMTYGDEFSDSNNPSQITYYLIGKKVTSLILTYDKDGRLVGVKKK